MKITKTSSDMESRLEEYVLPLTNEQKRMLFQCEASGKSSAFNESGLLEIEGDLNVEVLEKSINKIINRYSILRAIIDSETQNQRILNNIDFKIKCVNANKMNEEAVDELIREEIIAPFDLSNGPLIRAKLIKKSEEKTVFILTVHHIIMDGWSIALLFNELKEFYNSLIMKREVVLKAPVQFNEYVEWKNSFFNEEKIKRINGFWNEKLDGTPSFVDLSFSCHMNNSYRQNGERYNFIVEGEQLIELRKLATKLKTSLFSIMLASFGVLIKKITNKQSIMISFPTAGQNIMGAERLMGNCVSMIPIIIKFNNKDTLYTYVSRINKTLSELENISYITPEFIPGIQMDDLSEVSNIVFNMDRPMLNYNFEGTKVKFITPPIDEVSYDLFFNILDSRKELVLTFDYNNNIINENSIKRWAKYFMSIVEHFCKNENTLISDIDVISEEEKKQLLYSLNTFKTEFVESELGINLSTYGLKDEKNIKCYILDEEHRLVPIGVMGELYIGKESTEIYRTYQLAKFSEDGNIFIFGTRAQVVNLNGKIVSLKIIQDNIRTYEKIKNAFCRYDKKSKKIIAYLDLDDTVSRSNELIRYLKERLPEFMVPHTFVNASGHINDLQEISEENIIKFENENLGFVENKLIELCKEVLEINHIGVDDDFFVLGGDSLKAMRLLSKVELEFNKKILVRELFKEPTIRYIAELIKSDSVSEQESNEINKIEEQEYYEVSSVQKRMYVLHKLAPNSLNYNLYFSLIIEGQVDLQNLQGAMNTIIEHHEILRTTFIQIDGELYQKVLSNCDVYIDYKEKPKEIDIDIYIQNELNKFVKPFDLSKSPLIRSQLVKIEQNKYMLFFDIHHIIFDGTSASLFCKEFFDIYQGKELQVLNVQYKDYAKWSNKLKESSLMREQEKYWENIFANKVEPLNIRTDYIRPAIQSFEGEMVVSFLDEQIFSNMKKLCNDTKTTPFMLLIATLNVLFSKYSSQEDIVIGVPIEGRNNSQLDNLIGMFVNTLAIRNYPKGDKKFNDFLNEVKKNILDGFDNSEYQFDELVEKLNIKREPGRNPLFDIMLAYQNNPDINFDVEDLNIDTYYMNSKSSLFDLVFEVIEMQNKLRLNLYYSTKLFKRSTIERIIKHLISIIKTVIINGDISLKDVGVTTELEKSEILESHCAKITDYPKNKTISELFEEQVLKYPDKIAAVYKNESITYRDLNEKSNCLGLLLRKHGVSTNSIVGIITDRSIEMIIGILAILKSGGAYLPIDPSFPEERIKYMLEDSNADLLLTQSNYANKFDIETIDINDKEVDYISGENLNIALSKEQLAYIIYTSGSTGAPKGVMVQHCSVIRVVKDTNYIDIRDTDVVLQLSNFAFDGSVFDIFGSLLNGAKLVLIDNKTVLDVGKLSNVYKEEQITVSFITTALFNTIVDLNIQCLAKIRKILFGGERISIPHARRALDYLGKDKMIHVYGPTESTVFTTYYNINEINDEVTIPIGKPIGNTSIYIVDENNKLRPIGIPGELCIGGDGLAIGYLNNQELTEEKFIDNPFDEGKRMYRTGDLAVLRDDGNVEFIGRIDNQVKIRGFRIEIGEIEDVLINIDGIQEAIVVVTKEFESDCLCAYFTSKVEYNAGELREKLKKQLPEYMIPQYFIKLDKLPLNQNGKVDKNSLPKVKENIDTDVQYEAPRNEKEEKLVDIWETVLCVNNIGIKDNFFDLGGDSIKAIRIISKFQEQGFEIEVKDIFKYGNIKELVENSQYTDEYEICQANVEGNVRFTPIQKWFLENDFTDKHHFNQSVMLFKKEGFDEEILKKCFNKIVEHHDALRMCFKEKDNAYTQYNRSPEGKYFDLKTYSVYEIDKLDKFIEDKCNFLQDSIDLEDGALVKLGLFKTSKGDYLLVVVHHLVIDGVSWRIILEDLKNLYSSMVNGELITLPAKTNSFKEWSDEIQNYAQSYALQKEIKYWSKIESINTGKLIGLKRNGIKTKAKNNKNIIVFLNEIEMEYLLKDSNRAYRTEINDLLLTALAMALRNNIDSNYLKVNIEGHGREKLSDDSKIKIHRTIGWFTTQYPVVFDVRKVDEIGESIKYIKENLRKVPNKGIGYGIIKYSSDRKITTLINPEISFNYLGQFEEADQSVFKISNMSHGSDVSENTENVFLLDINSMIENKKMKIEFTFNEDIMDKSYVSEIANSYKKALLEISNHCKEKREIEKTPSDYGDNSLTDEELKYIKDYYENEKGLNIESIYKLSPMQGGMLFHNIMNRKSLSYFIQNVIEIEGTIDKDICQSSLDMIIQKYDILRTAFLYNKLSTPRQIVFSGRKAEVLFKDLSSKDIEIIDQCVDEEIQKDLNNPFNLESDILIRLSILKLNENKSIMIWSFHHIIMDGWCISIIMKEFFKCYYNFINGKEVQVESAERYSSFIKWLEKQDQGEAEKYWKEYIDEYEGKVGIPTSVSKNSDIKNSNNEDIVEINLELSKEITTSLQQLGNKYRVTLNSLLETVWGIIIQKYNSTEDVVFGKVVSGRNIEVPMVDKMLGLFINTNPIRIKCSNSDSFIKVGQKVQEDSVEASKYSYYPLQEIQNKTNQKQDLINNILVFENYYVDPEIAEIYRLLNISVKTLREIDQTSFNLSIIVDLSNGLSFHIRYNRNFYDDKSMANLSSHMENCIQQIIKNPEIKIEDIELISNEEKQEIYEIFNDTEREYPENKTLQELFEENVEKIPNDIAMLFEDKTLTYKELNEKANRLAFLLREKGTRPGKIVGIMTERSLEMVIGIIAILKAGGAYMPISPDYPEERIKFMLEDSNAELLLTQNKFINNIQFEGIVVDIDAPESYGNNDKNQKACSTARDLAYIIYTSGSTGKPKGVMIEHKSVVNRINWMQNRYPIGKGDIILQKTPYTFDVSVWELLWWSMAGASVCILKPGGEKDPAVIIESINNYKITTMHFVPSMLNIFLDYVETLDNVDQLKTLKQVFASGEALTVNQVEKFNRILFKKNGTKLTNLYGPTEAAIDVSYFDCSDGQKHEIIPIGKPIENIQLYIFDKYGHLNPVGITGELYIGGIGVARGYLNRDDLTKEKFIPNPIREGDKLYKTGDLARWMPNGNIEYLGRIDDQVKIRGFRIELGEIRAQILKFNDIKDAIVTANEDSKGMKSLCAYIVSKKEVNISNLKEYLAKQLPEYTIPSYFVQIDKIPLNPNGKVNKKALPEPDSNIKTEGLHEAPSDEIEEKLVEVWKGVLGIDDIGVNDSFFEMGGDSIKGIQMMARLYSFGLKLDMKDLFKNPRIKDLKQYVKVQVKKAKKGIVEGKIELTPIQKSFFKRNYIDMHHSNQAIMLHNQDRFDEDILRKVFTKLLEHHDALRMVYRFNGEEIEQYNRGIEDNLFELVIFDLHDEKSLSKRIEEENNKLQSSIDLVKGPIVKVALYKTEDGDHLFIAIHHLVIDGVSWRILLEDFDTIYDQVENNEMIVLPQKTSSYMEWAHKLKEYADTEEVKKEYEYWKSLHESVKESLLPEGNYCTQNLEKYAETLRTTLDIEETDKLLNKTHAAYNIEVNDILIAALGLAFWKWSGNTKMLIELEGHGREDIIEGIDLVRTVGWFTSKYPVLLPLDENKDIGRFIKNIKESIHNIPNKGIGYGILKYVRQEENEDINDNLKCEMSFNYLGQFDQMMDNKKYTMSKYNTGLITSPDAERDYKIEVNCLIIGRKLTMLFRYNPEEYNKDVINIFASEYMKSLHEIIEHCVSKEMVEFTPSDLTDENISMEEIEFLSELYD